MSKEFNKDLDKYIAQRKGSGLFSGFKFERAKKENSSTDISQDIVNALLEKKGIGPSESIYPLKEETEPGWNQVELNEDINDEKADVSSLDNHRKPIKDTNTEKLAALKEERMAALRSRVHNIMFGKRQKAEELDKVWETKREARPQAVAVNEKIEEKKEEVSEKTEDLKKEPKKSWKSFFSSLVQLKTGSETIKEVQVNEKQEEPAVKNQLAIFDLPQNNKGENNGVEIIKPTEEITINKEDTVLNKEETITNKQTEKEQEVDFSDLFSKEEVTKPEEKEQQNPDYKSFRELFDN